MKSRKPQVNERLELREERDTPAKVKQVDTREYRRSSKAGNSV